MRRYSGKLFSCVVLEKVVQGITYEASHRNFLRLYLYFCASKTLRCFLELCESAPTNASNRGFSTQQCEISPEAVGCSTISYHTALEWRDYNCETRRMMSLGNRLFAKCFKATFVIIITLCFASLLFMLQSMQFERANQRVQQEKANGVILHRFTQILTMPGGDDIPSSPPWSIPTVPVLRDPWELADNDSDSQMSQRRYITTKFFMSPGQGNLMFQYASVFGIAWRHNASAVIPEGMLLRRAFRLDNATVVSYRLSMYFLKNWKRKMYAQCCRYYAETEHLANGTHFALYGYFQSYKYFHTEDLELRKALRVQFRFLPEIENAALVHVKSALQKWAKANDRPRPPVLVGVHVRRGLDMTWNTRNQQHGHTVATKDYFLKALSYFRGKFEKNVLFLVCSDDFYWAKQNLGDFEDVYVVSSKLREVDMCVLSMCNHTIMSQGTFSWWAAYLAGGETVYYNGWPRPNSPLAEMVRKEDFFLPEWIPME